MRRFVFGALLTLLPLSAMADPLVLRAPHTAAPTEPFQIGLQSFADNLEKGAPGAFKVEILPNAQLGDEGSILKSLQSGAVAISAVSNAPVAEFVSELHLFDLPFLFRDRAQAYAVLDGPVGQSMTKALAAKGLILLGYYEAGIRNIMTNTKPINTLADLKGLKIRIVPSRVNLDTFRALGANPVPIQYSRLYVALQNKTVDGAEAANSNYEAKNFFEPAPNWAVVQWQILVTPLLMSKSIYDKMTPAQQAAIRAAGTASVDVERKAYQEADENALKKLLAAGVKVTHPDRQPWIDAVKPVIADWAKTVGEDKLAAIAATKG